MAATTAVAVALELAFVASLTTVSPKSGSKEMAKTATAATAATAAISSSSKSLRNNLAYQAKTLLLFTKSDLKTVLLPWTLFGIGHALSASLFHLPSQSTLSILARFPLVLVWVAVNLLPFCIGNQRNPTAVQEDADNKPWRPIPSKRITVDAARNLMIVGYAFAWILSSIIGGTRQCIALAVLGYLYNDLGGSDKSFLTRSLLNGLGFISFGSGAMEVALGYEIVFTPELVNWLTVIVLVVTSGIQTADMYDQEGDRAVGRSTLPLVIGDEAARWAIVVATLTSTLMCPWYWGVGLIADATVLICGLTVSIRCLKKRSVEQDRKTYKIWNLWLVAIYCLPLMKVLGL